MYSNFLFKKIEIEKSSYGIHGNIFCTKLKFVGTFMMLPCIPYCLCPCNWHICANVKGGVIKCYFILYNCKNNSIFAYYLQNVFIKLNLIAFQNLFFSYKIYTLVHDH